MDSSEVLIILPAPYIAIKSNVVKKMMYKLLRKNILKYLNFYKIKYDILNFSTSKFFLYTKDSKKAMASLKYCFGIEKFFLAKRVKFKDFDDLINKSFELSFKKLKSSKESFCVRTKSYNKKIKSKDIEISLGEKILSKNNRLKVNLTNPKIKVSLFVYEDRFLIYFDEIVGPKGIPVGVQGISAFFGKDKKDSEVIVKSLLKNGVRVLLIKELNKVNLNDLKNYNLLDEFKILNLDEAKELYKNDRIKAFFTDTKSLKEKEEFDKLIKEKTFAPLLV